MSRWAVQVSPGTDHVSPVVDDGGAAEREAERAAEVTARGGSVGDWSFSSLGTAPRPGVPGAAIPSAAIGAARPLDEPLRESFERQFGYDFTGVRVHDDARAARTAASLGAAAFTVGDDLGFARGFYRPQTAPGRRLIAHELAHVVQQRRAGVANGLVQARNFIDEVAIFLGISEGEFSRDELLQYLRNVTTADQIEDTYISDNKARAVVRHYQTGDLAFDLTARQKVLMTQEMLRGPTMAEDEEEIVALLEVSDDQDLGAILAPGQITVGELESDITGVSRARLDLLLAGRFVGGRDALLAGRVQPRGYPRRAFDEAALSALIDSDADATAIAQVVFDLPPVVRERGTRWLARRRAELDQRSVDLGREIAAAEEAEREPLRMTQRQVSARRHRVDVALQRLYRDVAGGHTRQTLPERTAAPFPTPQVRQQIDASIAPPVRTDPLTGRPAEFVSQILGEPLTYEQKLRRDLPAIIQDYYNRMVAGRGEAEHADPARTHTLASMERIANRAKTETDSVFGHLASSPALRADQPGRRGNIHDLFADYNERLQRMGPEERRATARGQMRYFFSTDGRIRGLNDTHNASPTYDAQGRPTNEVARIHVRLATEFTDTDEEVTRLLHIARGWPATANQETGHINIQLFRRPTVQADRLFLWDMFQTLIHEYMHTLAHRNYREYARSFGANSSRYNTLIEGVDSLLSEIAWANVEARVANPDLRRDVEGAQYAALPPISVPHPSQRRYGSYSEAVRLSQIVGIANLYSAYFLGDVSKIRA